MLEGHLDRDILESFVRGALGPAHSLLIEQHLRSGCASCQPVVDEIVYSFVPEAGPGLPDEIWDRLLAQVEQRLACVSFERTVAPVLVTELLRGSAAARQALVRDDRRCHTPAVCELLIERSFEAGFSDSAQAVELAELSVRVADRLDCGRYGPSVVHDLRARAWAHLGNARRLASDVAGAEQALQQAEVLLEEGSADPLEEARVLDLKASLLSDLGWFERAAETLDAVIEIYDDIRDPHRKGRALISQGLFIGYAGQAERAVASLRDGLAAIDRELEPRLVLMAGHNLAWFLNDCGRSDEAVQVLESMRGLYRRFGSPWTELRLSWLESRIAAGLGRLDEAESGLLALRGRLLAQGLCYDASMAALDLAGLYLRQGRSAAVRRLAEEMLPALLSRDGHREAVAALVAFQQEVELGRATPDLAQDLAQFLLRARKNPQLGFARGGSHRLS